MTSNDETNETTSVPPTVEDAENLLFRMYLAHEVATNQDLLDLNKKPELLTQDSLYNTVKTQVHAAFWKIFEDELNQDPPALGMAFQLLRDVKEGLHEVVTPNAVSFRNEIDQVLDIDHLKEQVERGALDVMYYAKFIINIMSRMCAPLRDEELAQLSKQTDLVQIFRGILETLDNMKLDLILFMLNSIKPGILANKMEFERKQFEDYVKLCGGKLPVAEEWIKRHINDETRGNFEKILYEAYMEILTWPPEEQYPETLCFDASRMVLMKRDYYKLTIGASILLLSFTNNVPEIVGNPDFKKTLKSHLVALLYGVHSDEMLKKILPNVAEQITNDSNEKLAELGLNPLSAEQMTAIHEQISGVTLPDNKIRGLVCKRVTDYLRSSLESDDPNLFPAALVLFSTELQNLKTKFKYLIVNNLNICRKQYESIVDSNTL